MNVKQALTERAKIKQRKPGYAREDIHKIMALRGTGWRRPTGLHSKMRAQKRGQPALLEPGYGSPREVHGMHPSGLYPVVVKTAEELKAVDAKTHGAVLAAGLGMKKKLVLLQQAAAQKVRVLNILKPVEYAAQAQQAFTDRKQARASAAATKAVVKEAEKKPDASANQKDAEPVAPAAESEKKELDKLLTKRDA